MVRLALALAPAESVSLTTNVFDPTTVGVPVTVQSALMPIPFGGVPLPSVQLYGGSPPVPEHVVVYETFTELGAAAHVALSGPRFTVSCRAWSSKPPSVSVARTVTSLIPSVVGVPLRIPPALRPSPAGSVPDVTDHV